MKKKSNGTLWLLMPILIILTFYLGIKYIKISRDVPIIAITQIIEHESLDEERKGLIHYLKENGYVDGKTIKIIYQNAQGSLSTARQIAQQMISQNPKVLIAISTPSAQVARELCLAYHIPLVFSAVTDPLEAKLVTDLKERKENITGISDNLPIEIQLEFIADFIPDVKRIGIIYNPGEQNSVSIVTKLHAEAQKRGITLVEAIASKTSEIQSVMSVFYGKVQAIYVPNDNTAVSAMSSIVQNAERNNIPVFAGDTGSVYKGAVATRGYNRFTLGKKLGEIVLRIIKGEKASDIPVATEHPFITLINKESFQKTGLSILLSSKQDIRFIEKEEK
ncbi:MAG: ABC transporter substrate-binding protein [Alphaproteobacteria bacterium]